MVVSLFFRPHKIIILQCRLPYSIEWEKEKTQEFEERQKRKAEKRSTDENENGTEDEVSKKAFPRGSMLKLSNLSAHVDRDAIKKALTGLEADVAFVDMVSEGVALVRLRGENAGKPVARIFYI